MLPMRKQKIAETAKRLSGLMLCALLLATLAGCPYVLVGGAAATGAFYYKGELRAQLEAPPDEVMAATRQAFDYFKWSTVEFKASRTDGVAKAKTAAGKNIKVAADTERAGLSEVSIRIGAFGDESLSLMLLEKIKEYLGVGVQET